jgi:hypothetical protein
VHPAEEPADAECHERRSIGLSFDCRAQPFVEGHGCIARGVGGLPVEVLCGPGRLVEFSLKLRFHVASGATETLFDLAAEVSGGARNAVFIHMRCPSLIPARPLFRALHCWSAIQREPCTNVPGQKGFIRAFFDLQ